MKLDAKSFALTAGIFWGLALFFLTLISIFTGYGKEFLDFVSSIYPGFKISIGGSFLGLIYGFVDGFIACYIFAWLYNLLARKRK